MVEHVPMLLQCWLVFRECNACHTVGIAGFADRRTTGCAIHPFSECDTKLVLGNPPDTCIAFTVPPGRQMTAVAHAHGHLGAHDLGLRATRYEFPDFLGRQHFTRR